MASRIGLHKVAGFYSALFVVGLVVARLADVQNVFTAHAMTSEQAGLRLLGGVALGALLAGLSAVATRFFEGARMLDASLAELLGPIAPDEALIMAGLSGIGEEVLFRGALQPILGLWGASLVFMLAHLPPKKELIPWTVTSGIAGLVLGAVTIWSGDLVAAIAAHFTVNAIGLWRLGKIAA